MSGGSPLFEMFPSDRIPQATKDVNIHFGIHSSIPLNYTSEFRELSEATMYRPTECYIHGSVHRDSILLRSNEMQQYAGVYLLQNYSTCFGCLSHTSSGVHQTLTVASVTGHIMCENKKLPPAWPN